MSRNDIYEESIQLDRQELERKISDLESLLREALDAVGRSGCQFWACPGPDEPYEDMLTCVNCYVIQEARKLEERYGIKLIEE